MLIFRKVHGTETISTKHTSLTTQNNMSDHISNIKGFLKLKNIYTLNVKFQEDIIVLARPFKVADILRDTVNVEKFLLGITGMAEYTKENIYIYV